MQPEEKDIPEVENRPAAWQRWLRRVLIAIGMVFLIFNLVFQIPAVQTWTAQRLTHILTQSTGTTVNIEYAHFAWFDRLVLEGVYLEDTDADTLLYTSQLTANFNLNPIVYLRRGLEVEEIFLKNAEINQLRAAGDPQNNIQKLLALLFPPKPEQENKNKRPFRMNVKRVRLQDVQFHKNDRAQGSRIVIFVGRGDIRLDSMDLPRKRFAVSGAEVWEPLVLIENFEQNLPAAMPVDTVATADTTGLHITVDAFSLHQGRFSLHNYRQSPVKLTPREELDYQHLEVFDIEIDINCFSFLGDVWQGQVPHISLRDLSGFELTEMAAADARVSPRGVQLNGLKIETPYSLIGDTLSFQYGAYTDFAEFPDAVNMRGRLDSASVALRDIMVFAPALENNTFFSKNKEKVVRIDGEIRGRVNNLRGSDLYIELADGSELRGKFSSRNLAVRDEQFLNLRLERLRTSIQTLRQLMPNFDPPANFDRLGRFDFSGRFDGFFADFVANGELRSQIGRARMDMRLDVKEGLAGARYSGALTLDDFDLGAWTQNPDFGIVNFTSSVQDGLGLTGETADAKLAAEIQSFNFRGYTYRQALLDGQINRTFFKGDFQIRDDNIDFSFTGELDFTDSIPALDFDAQINRLALQQLNLMKKDYVLAGRVDLSLLNTRLSEIEGNALIRDFKLTENGGPTYGVDSLKIESEIDSSGYRQLQVRSEAVAGEVTGFFDIEQIPDLFLQFFKRNYPGFVDRFGLKVNDKALRPSNFDYAITLVDSKGFNRLLSPQLGRLRDVGFSGHYDTRRDSILIDFSAPRVQLGKVELVDLYLQLDAVKDEGELLAGVWSIILNGKRQTAPIAMLSLLDRDTVTFTLNYSTNAPSLLANLNLNGQFHLQDTAAFRIQFDQSNLFILENLWVIERDNAIVFGKDFIDTRNFMLRNGERIITLESSGQKGLLLSLFNFDFGFIDDYWDYDPLDFGGKFDVFAEVGDVFKMTGLHATVEADTFRVNDDDWGALRLDAEAADLRSRAQGYLSITKDASQLLAEGFYNLADLQSPVRGRSLPDSLQNQYFDFDLNISNYPLDIAGYFVGDVLSDIGGSLDAGLRFWGPPKLPNVSGTAMARNGGFTVDFLQTHYTFREGPIRVDNRLFDASGTVLYDRLGHRAEVSGGISHQRLKNLGFDARLNTRRFLALDTDREDNDLFYGQALGSGQVFFSGTFPKPDVYVNASVGDSTRISIPVSSGGEASELQFVQFKERQPTLEEGLADAAELPGGLSFEMDLEITDQARMEIIFDEQAGDVIEGRGRGNIQILMPRGSEFQMFGDYVIEEGEYLFTLYNVVNKAFVINRGSTIRWSGDPYAADINVTAEYSDLSAPIYNFVSEYLNTNEEVQAASQATDINLKMNLQGELLQPIINFDLEFPQLIGLMKSHTERKLRYLQQDPNELNRQVFGLIVLGQFIPSSDLTLQGSEILYNTVSEFVSNQLSLLLTELFSELIADGEVLSGIDFDIAYNQYQANNLGGQGGVNRGDEFQVQLKQNFFNDRLTVLVGGNIDFGNSVATSPEASGAFVGNDLVIEYLLSKDRSLKLRVYQRLLPDIGGGSRSRLQVGTGLSFRREFDTFKEFLQSFRRASRRLKQK